jgi:hypothetical protein
MFASLILGERSLTFAMANITCSWLLCASVSASEYVGYEMFLPGFNQLLFHSYFPTPSSFQHKSNFIFQNIGCSILTQLVKGGLCWELYLFFHYHYPGSDPSPWTLCG